MPKPNELFREIGLKIKENMEERFSNEGPEKVFINFATITKFEYELECGHGQGPGYVLRIDFRDNRDEEYQKEFNYPEKLILGKCQDSNKKEEVLDNFLKQLNTDLAFWHIGFLFVINNINVEPNIWENSFQISHKDPMSENIQRFHFGKKKLYKDSTYIGNEKTLKDIWNTDTLEMNLKEIRNCCQIVFKENKFIYNPMTMVNNNCSTFTSEYTLSKDIFKKPDASVPAHPISEDEEGKQEEEEETISTLSFR